MTCGAPVYVSILTG